MHSKVVSQLKLLVNDVGEAAEAAMLNKSAELTID